jgi:hypothetical protein
VQAAVDAADDRDDVIKVAAGTYTGVLGRPVPAGYPAPPPGGVITQVVYISKTVTLRGGFTTTDWTTFDPDANLTTLDAQGQGRVLCIVGDVSATVEGLRIIHGSAVGQGGADWRSIHGAGGGVYVSSATVTLAHNEVLSNTTRPADPRVPGGPGAGLYFYGSKQSTLAVNRIGYNRASEWPDPGGGGPGGAARFYDSPHLTLAGNVIHDNVASWSGGLSFELCPTATLTANVIQGNVANHLGGGMKHHGGAHFLYSHWPTLIDNTIRGNWAANTCGGACFRNTDYVMLIGNQIVDNGAGSPCWVVSEGAGLSFVFSRHGTLMDNTISGNRTNTAGGGVYLWNFSTITLTGGTIRGNEASRGGGVFVGDRSTLVLSGVTIAANSVISYPHCNNLDNRGGGAYLNNSMLVIRNTVIADNRADNLGLGSGLYIDSSSPRLLHTTIARNHGGDGSGVYITGTGSTAALTNTILVRHTVGITVAARNTATLEATLWGTDTWANLADWGGAGTILTGTINLWGDPAFIDPGAGDYHIRFGSPAVDAGIEAGVTQDIDGDPRPYGMGYDMGADEFPIRRLCLPLVLKTSR